jgi:steroid 5-alpha reductase family enzyme
MYRDIAAAYLWLAVLWTLGSWAEAYVGVNQIWGFVLGLVVANALVVRAYRRQRRLAVAAVPAPAARVEVGPVVPA